MSEANSLASSPPQSLGQELIGGIKSLSAAAIAEEQTPDTKELEPTLLAVSKSAIREAVYFRSDTNESDFKMPVNDASPFSTLLRDDDSLLRASFFKVLIGVFASRYPGRWSDSWLSKFKLPLFPPPRS